MDTGRKVRCRNLVWHGVIGTSETFDLLMDALESCRTDRDLDNWHAWALSMEPAPNYAA